MEAKRLVEDFYRAVVAQKPEITWVHGVYDRTVGQSMNEKLRSAGFDPKPTMQALAEAGFVEIRPAKGGYAFRLKAPVVTKTANPKAKPKVEADVEKIVRAVLQALK